MKKLILAALLSSVIALPAEAANDFKNAGLNISSNSALGIQGEFDFPSKEKNYPDTAQVFLKNYTQNTSYGNVDSWSTTALGIAGIYDINSQYLLDNNVHPYAGIGLMYVNKKWAGVGPQKEYTGIKSGLYITGGITYALTPRFSVDFSYNNFGALTAGLIIGL